MLRSCRAVVAPALLSVLIPSAAFAQASGVANVHFEWTDREGGVHDLTQSAVEGFEDDSPLAPTDAGSGYTNQSGVFVFTGVDLGVGQTQTEFFGNVWASVGLGSTEWARVRDSSGAVYSQVWPPSGTFNVSDPPGTGSFTFKVDNTTASGAAMGMLQHVAFMRQFYAGLGATIPFVPIDWHGGTSGSFYCSSDDVGAVAGCPEVRIQIDAGDWASPDVILHEYGHHIAANNGMLADVGGTHYFGYDNIGSLNGGQNHGATTGSHLAWNEGTATFLAMMAIREGGLGTTSFPGLPARDRDAVYDDFNTPFAASTQTDADPGNNINISVGVENKTPTIGAGNVDRGEGDEMSVMRAMWDFSDSTNEVYSGTKRDLVDYSDQEMFDLMKNKTHFRDFWRGLTADALADPSNITLGGAPAEEGLVLTSLGMVLEEYRIAASPHARADTADTTPRLVFDEQNNDNSTRYAFAVYSEDWTTLVDSFVFSDTNGSEGTYFWDVSVPLVAGNTYHWAVLSNSAVDAGATPANLSDWYWSSADTFSILVPEAHTGLVLLLGLISAVRWGRERVPLA